MVASDHSPRRIFISYRHVEPDATLARTLAASLPGHEVFIDTEIPLGMEWGDVIEEKLGDADFLIALVSAAAAESPLVMTEIAEAHRLNLQRQRPTIIPVRLGGGFRLRYPLSAYVSRFQQATWSGPDDTERLVSRVKEALGTPPKRRHPAAQRLELIERVRGDWIHGVLEKSLYKVARIELGLTVDQTAVVRGLDVVVQRPAEKPRLLEPDTPLVDVFDDHRGQLLILGAPGAGKTTLLLELAQELLERAELDQEHPIPVVFNLSSWALQRPPLHNWMMVELNLRSDAPKKLAREWVTNEQILPLLDGLDEVASEHREACVEAINAYRREHGWLPIVVSSRISEYEVLTERLSLPVAVVIQPLKRAQIADYLDRAGPALTAVLAALRTNERLWDAVDTPLMLSVVALAYRNEQVSAAEMVKHDVFSRYLQAMFRRRAKETRFAEREIRYWLAWLAGNMARRGQTVFFLEDVVPEWFLGQRGTAWATTAMIMTTTMLSLLWMWVVTGAMEFVEDGDVKRLFSLDRWEWPTFTAPLAMLLAIVYGRQAGPVDALRPKWPGVKRFVAEVARGILVGWVAGTVLGYAGCSLVSGDLNLDNLRWAGVVSGIAGAVTIGVTFAAKALISPRMGGEREEPGALVRRSMASAGVSLAVTLLVSVPFIWYGIHHFPMNDVLRSLLLGGEMLSWGGLLVALDRGGYFTIRHYLARLLIWRGRRAPWDYVAFLDAAVDRIFMRKVGGGYMFVHRMLMEYLAGGVKSAWEAPRTEQAAGGGA
jgi:DNA polymerase III delta prime subunit